jgi:hypothetical protein
MKSMIGISDALLMLILMICITDSLAVNVKDYGAIGDGIQDDTEAIKLAVLNSDDGLLLFPQGNYLIKTTIEVPLESTGILGIQGVGGSATLVMEGVGPALHIIGNHQGTSAPESVTDITMRQERMPTIRDLEIVGRNSLANGIQLSNTFMAIISSVFIREVQYGIHLTVRNRNVIIEGAHIYNCSKVGIFAQNVNIHQMNIDHCHISYNKQSGLKIEGSEIRNLQITGNDIEYNYGQHEVRSADIWIDCTKEGSSVREGAITGNTIQSKASVAGCNLFFEGNESDHNKIGLWSINSNHISSQSINIYLKSTRGVSIVGNTFIRGFDRHLLVENSKNIIIGNNIFDKNEDYIDREQEDKGGIRIVNSEHISLSDLIIDDVIQRAAIEIENGTQISISNCHIPMTTCLGIDLTNCSVLKISDCLFYQTTQYDSGSFGLYLDAKSNNIMVNDNVFNTAGGNSFINVKANEKVTLSSNMAVKP